MVHLSISGQPCSAQQQQLEKRNDQAHAHAQMEA